jgi:hypothetical protein
LKIKSYIIYIKDINLKPKNMTSIISSIIFLIKIIMVIIMSKNNGNNNE